MLTVYKASAGSGKTFQLVAEYLKLLLKNPNNYRHILAVTFTNKATNEMKSRILEQLYKLASKQKSDYLEVLQQENSSSEETIRYQAQNILKSILHDYNRFSINTIDSFTQKVIKAFNRELGISPNFTLELDSSLILEEAVDNLISKIDTDKKLLQWLKEFSKEKIEGNYSQRIDEDIKSLGTELFKENFQLFFPNDGPSFYSREKLEEFGKELNDITRWFDKILKAKGKEAITHIFDNSFTLKDFSYGNSGVAGYLKKIADGEIKEAGTRVLSAAENPEKWIAKKHKQYAELLHLVESKLQPALNEILSFYTENNQRYQTAVVVNKQLRMLGILTDLKEEIRSVLHEKGVLQMSDSNLLLSKIIGHSDSPFVYEKIGNFYKHFMLDEFQDTSGLQWKNFKPLLINSLAEGNKNLIVGDVKQSIYRWRNSDWNILAEQLNNDFYSGQLEEHTLANNWRSDNNIIQFNNEIIEALTKVFETDLFGTIEDNNLEFTGKFKGIYASFKQTPGKQEKEKKGFVKINFLAKESFYEDSTQLLIEQVKELQNNGLKASEIAILIRKNREGAQIIEAFLSASQKEENKQYNLSVLSNESLFLHASKGVQFIVEIIELIITPENNISKATLLQLWESWLKPELTKRGYSVQLNKNQYQINLPEEHWQLDDNLVECFEEELADKLDKIRAKVLLSSLDETIIHISNIFGLFKLNSELPFIQTLIDKAGELKASLSNDLSNFLFWWNEKGQNTSVNVNEDIESIRLLTVHKSKGLEFKALLLPYLNWSTTWSGQNAPVLWCSPNNEPFNKFPLLPVKAGNSMAASDFKADYFQEKVNYFIDTLNLVYVAFTRAKSVLLANCPAISTGKSSKNSGHPFHSLLYKALENLSASTEFMECWNNEKTEFKFGTIPQFNSKTKASDSIIIKNYSYHNFMEKLKLRFSAENFLVEGENNKSEKNTGTVVHDILSKIKTKDDVEKACLNAFLNGKISEEELVLLQAEIEENINLKQVKKWFDGSYLILNERDLISKNRKLRPDRIMVDGKNAIVVDYKTGEKNQEKYHKQVINYAEIIKETGFDKVEGYLWYLHLNEVEKVCEK